MKYSELKTETQYLKKLVADLVSRFGDSVDAIAYSWMVYALTGSAALTAVTYAVNTIVSVLLSPFTAALITKWNKKAVMISCDIGRGALVASTALLFLAGLLRPWMVVAITALNSTFEAFRQPAGMSIFPQIVSKEKYTLATSLSGALSRTAELVGMGAAGIFIGTLGVTWALLIDAFTFFFSAAVISTLRLRPHIAESAKNALREFVISTKEGFAYMMKNKVVLAICGLACFLNFSITPLNALQTAYINESLHLGAEALSVMGVAMMLGMVLGSLTVPKLLERVTRFRLMVAGALGASLSISSLAFVPRFSGAWIWVSLTLALFVGGVFASFVSVVINVAFMERTEEQFLARASGIMTSLCMAAMPVASFICAALAKVMGIHYIFLVFGIFSMAASLSVMFVKTLREL